MATEIVAGAIGERRAVSTASGGTALTTTAGFIQLPRGAHHIFITPRNFATAVVAKIAINPWLVVLKTTDNMATVPVDYSEYAQDNDTTTLIDVSSLGILANGDFLLVGSHVPFRGVYFDVYGVNGAGTATVAVYYWNGLAWADTSATVTGIRTTMVWDKDGIVTWTVPTAWQTATIANLYPTMPTSTYYSDVPLYWTRWSVDAALADTDVTISSMSAANRSTAYAEYVFGQTIEERIQRGFGGVGCIEALTDAGTANLIVNVATARSGNF